MATNRHASRRSKLLRAIRKEGADAILVTNEKNVSWLTGFTGDSTWMLLSKSNAILLSELGIRRRLRMRPADRICRSRSATRAARC